MAVKETTKTYGTVTTYIREFDNMDAFYGYITKTPLNGVFQWKTLSSVTGSHKFTQTKNYEEATKLLQNGWDSMANELVKKLKVEQNQIVDAQVKKILFDVVGFQASVPRYLQGIPTSMVNKKLVPVKQRVITLNKDISYNCGISTDEIIKASVQTLHLIKKIEAQGIRVNLNLIWAIGAGQTKEVLKIRLKSANERLNISKLAFPLVHPSMLRRLCFRYVETAPTITQSYEWGYGVPMNGSQLKQYCEGEYVLPRLFDGDLSKLGDLSSICNLTDQIVNGKNDKVKI